MKIKILKNTMVDKKPVKAGEIVEVSEKDAKILLAMKKAEMVGEQAEKEKPVEISEPPMTEKAEMPEPEMDEMQTPQAEETKLETEPKPQKIGRKPKGGN